MYKQVIVMRKDLGMRKGKMVAQGAHASLGAIINSSICTDGLLIPTDSQEHLSDWIFGDRTKICVYVNSEEELLEIYKEAVKTGMPGDLITDAGYTEFNGVPTKTCCAIGPWDSEEIDKITGHLKLL
jgi:PTH2 family peptidyl-tRNA hydrolase